jgi:predicted transposase/invertase (TIGR01784 family)
MMAALKYTFKTDILFKMLFTKYPELLKKLVSELLQIPDERIGQFEIRNPDMPPENLGDKFCRLDINMMVDGRRVDLEVQVENEGDYPERALYHWAREYSTSLPAGEGYSVLPQTIVISILNFNLFKECGDFHSEFQLLEVTRHTPLTDRQILHFFELPKIPRTINANDMLLLWLSLFKAQTEEELQKIAALEVPVMNQAINAYNRITVSAEFLEKERLREKARHDEAQALYNAARIEREKWQGVVADKDAEIARLRAQLTKETEIQN